MTNDLINRFDKVTSSYNTCFSIEFDGNTYIVGNDGSFRFAYSVEEFTKGLEAAEKCVLSHPPRNAEDKACVYNVFCGAATPDSNPSLAMRIYDEHGVRISNGSCTWIEFDYDYDCDYRDELEVY